MELDELKSQGDGHEKHERGERIFNVFVNEHPVRLLGHAETGVEIKTAAIEQGVPIHLSFVLEEEFPNGSSRVVGDHERVDLRENLRFKAHKASAIISVNEQPVEFDIRTETGAEIKAAAISQGVHIQLNFVLQEELPNGTSRIVGDNDKVHLHEHLRFTAIAPDDNS
jgi:hypothetical protein